MSRVESHIRRAAEAEARFAIAQRAATLRLDCGLPDTTERDIHIAECRGDD